MKFKRLVGGLVSISLIFSSFSMGLASSNQDKTDFIKQKAVEFYQKKSKKVGDIDFRRALQQKFGVEFEEVDNLPKQQQFKDKVRVIVEVDSPTALELLKQKNLPISKLKEQEAKVSESQSDILSKIKNYGQIRHTYKSLLNGFSMTVNYKDVENIKKIPGVKKVTIANVYSPEMNTAKDLIKATSVWQSLGLKGEGMVVSIIDTGIDYTHKDMKITDTSKEKLTQAKVNEMGGPGKFYTDKVPYGYNFADLNDDVVDRTSSMHGMHVGGIVAANGEIKGVAPEAQLLSMKVFSNNPELFGAYSDDIAAAIEDSVKHGADVINMSLGSTAGFVLPDDPEQRAIKNATDAGVLVVVSGGNSYYSTYGYYYPYEMDTDIGLVGSPGLYEDTLQVASSENDKVQIPALTYTNGIENGKIGYVESEVSPTVLRGEFEIVDCGLGRYEDFLGKNVMGKIALIERGKISFVEKKLNAQMHGAAGAIIYNHEQGGDTYIDMVTDPSVVIPAIFIRRSDGLKLKSTLNVRVSFKKNDTITIDNVAKGSMSDFSSWGTTPDLSFKPDVSAPGGQIYSTVNDNKYQTMSGTSMAAPNASGAAALVIQTLKKNNPNLTGRQLVEMAKILLSNSAEQVIDENGVPYSPRKQGAGIINVEKAANAKAYIVAEDNKPNVSLKDFVDSKEFILKIKNISSDDMKFKLTNPYGVLSNYTEGGFAYTTEQVIDGTSISFENDEVYVKAGQEVSVKATLNVQDSVKKNIFLEGFIKVEEIDNKTSPMIVPFVGFYGEWDTVRIFDAPVWDGNNTYYGITGLIDIKRNYLGLKEMTYLPIVQKDKISISPNGDGVFDNVQPIVSFLRNAKEFKIELLDENMNKLRDISFDKNIRKNLGVQELPAYFNPNWLWDGMLYNMFGMAYPAPEGQYYIRLKAKIDYKDAEWQELNMPVKVDLTQPNIKVNVTKKQGNIYNFDFTGSNDNVGIYGFLVFRNEFDENPEFVSIDELNKDVYIPQGFKNSIVCALDFAGNVSMNFVEINNDFVKITKDMDSRFVEGLPPVVDEISPIEFEVSANAKYFLKETTMRLDKIEENDVQEVIAERIVDGSVIDLRGYNLQDGCYSLQILLKDKDGNCFAETGTLFILDTIKPKITGIDEKIDITKAGRIYNVKFDAEDNLTGYELYFNGQKIDEVKSTEFKNVIKSYSIPLEIKEGENKVEIKVVDFAGNESIKNVIINVGEIDEFDVELNPHTTVLGSRKANINGRINTNKSVEGMVIKILDKEFKVNSDGSFELEVSSDTYFDKQYKYTIEKNNEKLYEGSFNVYYFPVEILSDREVKTNSREYILKLKLAQDFNADKVEVVVNGDVTGEISKDKLNGEVEYKVSGLDKGYNSVGLSVVTQDSSNGMDLVYVYVDNDFPTVTVFDQYNNNLSMTPVYNEKNIKIFGICNEEVKSLKINGEDVALYGDTFEKDLVLEDGLNRIFFEIEDAVGNINKYVYKVYCDTTAPSIEIPFKDVVVADNSDFELSLKVKDNTLGYRVYINNNQVFTEENENATGVEKEYKYNLILNDGLNLVKVDVVDQAGNAVSKLINIYKNPQLPVVIDRFVSFDRISDLDLSLEMYIPNGYNQNLKEIRLNNTIVSKDKYSLENGKLTIKSNYLKTLDRGIYEFNLVFEDDYNVTFTVNVFDERNSNTNLKTVYVNGEVILLNENGEYVVEAELNKEYIVTADAEDSKAKVEVTQSPSIPGTAKIKITAEDGTVRIYEVKIIYPIELSLDEKAEFKAGEDARVVVNAKNVSLSNKNATLVVGLYDTNNNLVNYMSGKYLIKSNDTVEMCATLKLASNMNGYKLKVFVWEDIKSMKAISKRYEFFIK